MIYRLFVEKKKGYDNLARQLLSEIKGVLNINAQDLRVFLRYDVTDITSKDFEKAIASVFSEPPVDNVYRETLPKLSGYTLIGTEYLPGQYDQRADSAAQCVQLLNQKSKPLIRCATIYAIKGINEAEADSFRKYIINPVESRECLMNKPESLELATEPPQPTKVINGFCNYSQEQLAEFLHKNGFAMTLEDLLVVQKHFATENRDPNEAELKVIDTYWSDHCRHTTFLTELKDIKINSNNPHIAAAYQDYIRLFNKYNSHRTDKYQCLMDIATIAVKELREQGHLDNLDISDEINACSIKVKAEIDGREEDWLVMFKNETHNHPTEIEPFGGAATCLGGAIRDPLSGRVYVYQAMRVTGAADPTQAYSQTIKGKLPQRVITKKAAAGYSSYGNQIGLATGMVSEIYHSNYVAKRLETGFVVGAAPQENVIRAKPQPSDIVVLIGGETGRDGIGGATGSSKAHTVESKDTCGAEVQKGNPLTERKIQRLFTKKEVTNLIKKCNDFGAGGVSVAIGELADGLDIYLDLIPKKYEGLTVTELAVAESQERMAVVIAEKDFEKLKAYCDEENVDATIVARITGSGRMKMLYENKVVIDIDRKLLNSNGAKQSASAIIEEDKVTFFDIKDENHLSFADKVYNRLQDLNICSKKGLVEMFDSTVGAGTVNMPFGGKNQITPSINMQALLPAKNALTATVASWGYNPYLMSESCFLGAVYSVVTSVIKVALSGAAPDSIRLSLQEYFLRLGKDSKRWGLPLGALLGALSAQLGLKKGAIGGKDSMSGTFENIDVPPTLISFALGIGKANKLINNVLPNTQTDLILIKLKRDSHFMPDFEYILKMLDILHKEIEGGNIEFAQMTDCGGAVIAAMQSALGNGVGIDFENLGGYEFADMLGDVIITTKNIDALKGLDYVILGFTNDKAVFTHKGESLLLDDVWNKYTSKLENVFPTTAVPCEKPVETLSFDKRNNLKASMSIAKPRVFIAAFPGTNCEVDTQRAFERAGAVADIFVVRNRNEKEITESVAEIVKRINNSNILAFPGGFSGGDEPDGSGKFIAATFQNPYIKEAVMALLARDGLIIGICNGFQALVKLGLLPYGEIRPMSSNSPTLTFNNIGRHVSTVARVRISSVMSPWLQFANVGEVYGVPISHGEGKFVADQKDIDIMIQNGQIFSQYCDEHGNASMVVPHNPNGSMMAIEGITSTDGRILGKMGHIERCGENLLKNVPYNFDIKIFESGVKYFK